MVLQSVKQKLIVMFAFLGREIPYPFTFLNMLAISAILGGIQVFITIFLEPHGTDLYEASYRNLRLAGYSLCFVGPFLLFYSIERIIKKWQNGVWYVYNELLSKSLLIVAIATASYFYNITVINTISPSIERWVEHMLVYAWPYVPLFIPFLIIIYAILYWNHSPEEKKLIIKGQNQEDILEITKSQFIYAESDQNYVSIYFKNGDQIDKKLMRSSLQAIEDQLLDAAVRVHRSYLINPIYLKKIKGNKRKQTAILKDVESIIPVSANFDGNSILKGSR